MDSQLPAINTFIVYARSLYVWDIERWLDAETGVWGCARVIRDTDCLDWLEDAGREEQAMDEWLMHSQGHPTR